MSDERPPARAPEVLAAEEEPAAAGDGDVVPGVEAWQRAADSGAVASGRARGDRPGGPPWVPASAALPLVIRAEIVDWMRGALPNEGCGVLVSARTAENGGVPDRFVGMRNVAASPYRYLMDSEELLRVSLEVDDNDEIIWGVVHSHVASPPYPSPTDIGLAAYPDAVYILVSFASEPPELRGWTIVDGAVNEVVLERT